MSLHSNHFKCLFDDQGMLESSHHPFTTPHPEDKSLISTNPEKVIVCTCTKNSLNCQQYS